jgi:hypothetical protein
VRNDVIGVAVGRRRVPRVMLFDQHVPRHHDRLARPPPLPQLSAMRRRPTWEALTKQRPLTQRLM